MPHTANPFVIRALTLLVALAAAFAAAPLPAHAATRAEQLGPALRDLLASQRTSINIPGVTATVIFPDGSRWSGASGNAHRAPSPTLAASRHMPFVVGSITKTFVAALILDLQEEGALDIDDRLSNWLPSYPNAANLTLRQLLSHTSGVFNYFEHRDYNQLVFSRPSYSWTPPEILSTFQRAPYFAPGAGYHYSNTGFVLLGMVAEAETGIDLRDLLAARFWTPLGLSRTHFQGDGPPPSSSAKGYLLTSSGFREISDSTGYRPTRSAATVAWAAGAVVSTADDIATWARALYEGDVLSAGSLAEMLDWDAYPGGGRYGLGVRTRVVDGRRMYGHTGSLRGFSAAAWHLPAHDLTVVVETNRGRISANQIADAILARVFRDTTPPSVPSGLAGVAQADRVVKLTWNAATDNAPGTIRYRVFRDGVAIGSQTTLTAYSDRPAAGVHSYRVRAIDAAGNRSALSASVYVTASP